MSDNDAENIKLRMREAEEQYKETEKAFEYLIDLYNDSIQRNKNTLERQSLSHDEYEELKEIDSEARKNLNDLFEQRDQNRYEYKKRMDIYAEELKRFEKEHI